MRRLLGLAVLAIVLFMSVPSYGYFLIYNVSATIKGNDAATDAKVTIPLKAYLVLKFNDSNNSLADTNLILYGKNSWGDKVYVQLSDGNELTGIGVQYIGKDMVVGFGSKSPYRLEMLMSGQASFKDIGLGTPKRIAGSIKGVAPIWGGFLLGPISTQRVSGTANASAILWTAMTRYANANGWTQDQIVLSGDGTKDGLIQILEGKGYYSALSPPTDDYYDGVGLVLYCTNCGAYGINGSIDEITIVDINAVDINNDAPLTP